MSPAREHATIHLAAPLERSRTGLGPTVGRACISSFLTTVQLSVDPDVGGVTGEGWASFFIARCESDLVVRKASF